MTIDQPKSIKSIYKIIAHSVPSLIAIAILELVNAEMYYYGPFAEKEHLFTFWNLLQLIPAFAFGYISDRNYRKTALVISQILGLIGGIALYIFGIQPWVLIFVALTFNPMPVARAALLDNFPHYSTLKLVAITFLAQNLPWAFFSKIGSFSLNSLILFTFALLFINIILTYFLFVDRKDLIHRKVEVPNHNLFDKNNRRIAYTLIAFTLSELTFFLVWVFIEHSDNYYVWLNLTTLGTLIGISCAMLYNRLPHLSIITLFYTIGFGVSAVAIFTCITNVFSCGISLLSAISHYCVVGGLYLPFVTEAVINMAGTRHKAIGAAMVESGDTIALVIAPFILVALGKYPLGILFLTVTLYFCAAILQKRAERLRPVIFD